MLKIVYPICCGLDVHRDFVYACIATTVNGVTTYKSHRFSTFTKGLRELLSWLLASNCKDVCMESTGKYWIPVYNILETDCKIVLAHPKYVKAIRGKKTDKKDAKWIADIFKHDLVSGSFIPPADIRQLRDLVRYHTKLTNFTTGEKNRVQNCLTVSNLKLDSVFSDVFGKASSNIIGHILANPSVKLSDVSAFRTKGMKATDEEILEAVDGEIYPEQAEKLRIIRDHMSSLDLCKANLQSLILSATFPELMDRKKCDIMEWTQTNPKSQEEFLCQSKKEQCHLVMTRHLKAVQLKWSPSKAALPKRLLPNSGYASTLLSHGSNVPAFSPVQPTGKTATTSVSVNLKPKYARSENSLPRKTRLLMC